MSRLLSFGCSVTYGVGLKDCWPETTSPSNFVWPAIVGRKLGLDTYNLSCPGSSNRQIWWKVVNTEFKKDDTVVFLWSYPYRYCFLEELDNPSSPPKVRLGLNDKNTTNRAYQKYKVWSNDFDTHIESLTFMNYVDMFLKNQGLNNIYHYTITQDWEKYLHQPWNKIKILGSAEAIWFPVYHMALDNLHPGEKCQQMLAYHVSEEIKKNNIK